MSFIPKQESLVTTEILDAFASLTLGIRHAETVQELLLYMERLHRAKMEVGGLVAVAEGEVLRASRRIADGDELPMGELHQVREREEARERDDG